MQRSSPKRRLGFERGSCERPRVDRRCPSCCPSSAAAAAARVSRRGTAAARGAPAAARLRGAGATAVKASWKLSASLASAASGGDALARKPRPAASRLGRAGTSSAGKDAKASMAPGERQDVHCCSGAATPSPPSANTARACTYRAWRTRPRRIRRFWRETAVVQRASHCIAARIGHERPPFPHRGQLEVRACGVREHATRPRGHRVASRTEFAAPRADRHSGYGQRHRACARQHTVAA